MTGPVVAVYDPSRYPFSLAAVIGCADRDHAAAVVAELRAEYPAGIVTVVYPGQLRAPGRIYMDPSTPAGLVAKVVIHEATHRSLYLCGGRWRDERLVARLTREALS